MKLIRPYKCMPSSSSPAIAQRLVAVLVFIGVFATGVSSSPADASPSSSGVLAEFEGRIINLSHGWGDAVACLVLPSVTQCFRSVEEMTALEANLDLSAETDPPSSLAATCSTSLRLYDGTYQTGSVLSIANRGQWMNLSAYGFDNRTSSYRVGACAVDLASGSSGGGSHYFRCLSAYCEEDVMASGWNNVISSVYLK